MADKKKAQHQKLIIECLGKAVAARRKRLGMSQEELAEESGVDRAFISKIERGRRNPSFALISHISHGLHMRFSRLVANCEECANGSKTSATNARIQLVNAPLNDRIHIFEQYFVYL